MNAKSIFRIVIATILVASAFFALINPVPVQAQVFQPTQEACNTLAEKFANVAQPNDPQWVACFTAGWVNWVFSADQPLPKDPPVGVAEALKKGSFAQLTEPWRKGCDNTLLSPHCSIGFVKLFGDWGTLRSFLAVGEFTQADVVKKGPWSEGSLWMTSNYVQVAEGEQMTDQEKALFCDGALGWAFAFDGEFPLPKDNPCADRTNTFFVRERWNGGCIGNQLPDASCNVGEILTASTWEKVLELTEGSGWNRGSVFAIQPDLVAMEGIVVATATPSPTATATRLPSQPTNIPVPTTGGGTSSAPWPWWTWGCLLPLAIVALLVVIFRRPLRDRWNTMRAQMEADGD